MLAEIAPAEDRAGVPGEATSFSCYKGTITPTTHKKADIQRRDRKPANVHRTVVAVSVC